MARNLHKLKDQATKALDKGKHKRALDIYLELEAAEPGDGNWPRRAADMYRRLNREAEAQLALERAADKYAKAGFVVKAIAVCKMILARDPKHSATQQRLVALNAQRGITVPGRLAAGAASRPATGTASATPPHAERTVAPRAPAPIIPPPPVHSAAAALDSGALQLDPDDADVELELDTGFGMPERSAPPPRPATPPPPPPRTRTLPPGAPLDSISLGDVLGAEPSAEIGEIQDIPLELDLDVLLQEAEDAVEHPGAAPVELALIEDDESAREAARRLRETPFFSALGPGLLESFIDKVKLVELASGQVLFREGDTGNTLYVIAEGEVVVYSEGPPRVQLSRLGEGDFFGEIALVTDQPRSATIEALAPTELLAIDRDIIGDLVDEEPQLLRVLLRFLRDRLFNTLIHTNALFGSFGGAERQELAEKFRFLEGERGALLIEQGRRAQGLYILLAGQAEVSVQRDGGEQRLATLGPGDVCGEMSLLAHDAAVASVRLTSKAFVLKLPADVFRQVIMTHPQVLMFVGDLAEERKRQLAAIQDGQGEYEIAHLDLL